jgi:Fe-S cluster biogenesis protein NfuA
MSDIYVSLEFTPNPNTLKYAVNRILLEKGSLWFKNEEAALGKSPLATKLFEVFGVSQVMLGRDFVTITKDSEGDWDLVHRGVSAVIQSHVESNLPIVTQEAFSAVVSNATDEIERKIREVLDQEIRPAVAMDGGDISFERFEDGVVYVALQGACSGCPSSTATLKMGVESRLRAVVPEVLEVVSI